MLRILVVEDDRQLAETIKYQIEDNPRYRVVGTAEDADGAIAAVQELDPDLVLLDLHLANGSTGFSVAVRLNDFGVPCLFVSGNAIVPDARPGARLPDEAVHGGGSPSLARHGGRPAARPRSRAAAATAQPHALRCERAGHAPRAGLHPLKRSLRTRIEHWLSGHQY